MLGENLIGIKITKLVIKKRVYDQNVPYHYGPIKFEFIAFP